MLAHETNSFSPIPTGLEDFHQLYIPEGELADATSAPFFAPLRLAREKSHLYNWDVFQGISTYGSPGGAVDRKVYEDLRDIFLSDLEAVMPIDIVALMLHGAMLAEGYDNCEGDLLSKTRQIVGNNAVIGAVLDSHAHLTHSMTESADFLIATKEYPHSDFEDRSVELVESLRLASCGLVKPVKSVFDCRMIDVYHTPREPMRGFINKIKHIEKMEPDVLSISVIHSFPWADSPVMGTKVLVITDNNSAKGDRLAEQLGMELFSLRGRLSEGRVSVERSIDLALRSSAGPVVLADAADNPGGGAPCDSTFILSALLKRGIGNAAIGRLYDPAAVDQILNVGEGDSLKLMIGGKLSPFSGESVEIQVKVERILRSDQKGINGEPSMGFDAAWIRGKGIDIVLGNGRMQTFTKEEFMRFGIPIQKRKIVVVKSSQHFFDSFSPIASKVLYVDTPGVLTRDLKSLPYSRIMRPKWPFDENPFLQP